MRYIMQSHDTNLRRAYKTKFKKWYKTKLDWPCEVKGMTQVVRIWKITFRNTLAHQTILKPKWNIHDITEIIFKLLNIVYICSENDWITKLPMRFAQRLFQGSVMYNFIAMYCFEHQTQKFFKIVD